MRRFCCVFYKTGKILYENDLGIGRGFFVSDSAAVKKLKIRVRKEDSAFVYAILEANEGICSYSTLPHQTGDLHRDLELSIPLGLQTNVDQVLEELRDSLELFVLPE